MDSNLPNSAEAVAAFIAGLSLVAVFFQIKATAKYEKGRFLLELDSALQKYSEIHRRLMEENPAWRVHTSETITHKDMWLYMGLFERINNLRRDNILRISEIYDFYGYRILYLISNETVSDYLTDEDDKNMWQGFIELIQCMEKYMKAKNIISKRHEEIFAKIRCISPRRAYWDENWRYSECP